MNISFQELLLNLKNFWGSQGCVITEPYDLPMGAATFHPDTFFRSLGKQPWAAAYCQPCRRPADGRFGENPNRLGRYYQFQVLIKPSPADIQEKYLASLACLGLTSKNNDIRFVEDNWESPALAAWGLGWEVWLNGMEISQFTYFQQMGGQPCDPVSVEITYGCERIAMYLQKIDSVYDIVWQNKGKQLTVPVTYGERYQKLENQQSKYSFEKASVSFLQEQFTAYCVLATEIIQYEESLPIVAYEQLLLASHTFNLLDARGAYTVAKRKEDLLTLRKLSISIAQSLVKNDG